ncbi:hypothetical protein CCP3SC1AL1_110002 [Gammaproteobacteria bacterium]
MPRGVYNRDNRGPARVSRYNPDGSRGGRPGSHGGERRITTPTATGVRQAAAAIRQSFGNIQRSFAFGSTKLKR